MKAKLKWAAVHLGLFALAWLGWEREIVGAQRVALFFCIYAVLLGIGAQGMSTAEFRAAVGRASVPLWLSTAAVFGLAGFFVWHGAWWCGSLWTIGRGLSMAKMEEARREEA